MPQDAEQMLLTLCITVQSMRVTGAPLTLVCMNLAVQAGFQEMQMSLMLLQSMPILHFIWAQLLPAK